MRNGKHMQNMSPKVDANTLGPASYPENPGEGSDALTSQITNTFGICGVKALCRHIQGAASHCQTLQRFGSQWGPYCSHTSHIAVCCAVYVEEQTGDQRRK